MLLFRIYHLFLLLLLHNKVLILLQYILVLLNYIFLLFVLMLHIQNLFARIQMAGIASIEDVAVRELQPLFDAHVVVSELIFRVSNRAYSVVSLRHSYANLVDTLHRFPFRNHIGANALNFRQGIAVEGNLFQIQLSARRERTSLIETEGNAVGIPLVQDGQRILGDKFRVRNVKGHEMEGIANRSPLTVVKFFTRCSVLFCAILFKAEEDGIDHPVAVCVECAC